MMKMINNIQRAAAAQAAASRRSLSSVIDWSGDDHPSRSKEPVQLAQLGNVSIEVMTENQVDQTAELFTDIWVDGSNSVHTALGTTREEHIEFSKLKMRGVYENRDTVVVARDLASDNLLGFSLNCDLAQPGFTEEQRSALPTIIQRHLSFLDWAQDSFHSTLLSKQMWTSEVDEETGRMSIDRRSVQLGDIMDNGFFGVRPELEGTGTKLGAGLIFWAWALQRHMGYSHCVGLTTHVASLPVARNVVPVQKVFFRDYVEADGTRLLENLVKPPYCLVAYADLTARSVDVMINATCREQVKIFDHLPQLKNKMVDYKTQRYGSIVPAEALELENQRIQEARINTVDSSATTIDDAAPLGADVGMHVPPPTPVSPSRVQF